MIEYELNDFFNQEKKFTIFFCSTTVTPDFSILRPLSTGLCGSATDVRIAIRFGENVQSTCEQA